MNKLVLISALLISVMLAACCPPGGCKTASTVPLDKIQVEDNLTPVVEEPVISVETPTEDVTEPAAELSQCSDTIDNDNDGYVDFPNDFGCDDKDDNNEVNDGTLMCNNGLDDDNDGLVDERDPGCNAFRENRGMDIVEEAPAETPVEEVTSEEEPAAEEVPGEIVIIIQETELVNLQPVATDPDKDKLDITYTTPLNKEGQWQTTYGDAGQYTVTITVSDGELTASKDALLLVNKKEEAPTIDSSMPGDVEQQMDEATKLDFKVTASDLNKDPLTYEWKLDGELTSVSDSFSYEPDYNSAGSHTIKLDVSDGTTTVSKIWSVTVANVDRPPVLKLISDITVKETERVKISPEATDPDEDELRFSISDPVGDSGEWKTTYDDSGVYSVKVTVSDGELEDSQDVKVTVINVNRPPVITNIVQVK